MLNLLFLTQKCKIKVFCKKMRTIKTERKGTRKESFMELLFFFHFDDPVTIAAKVA